MKIVLKHTLKNMISKPLRTGMLVFCIAICSFAGMLVFDLSDSLENIINSFYGQLAGNSDLVVAGSHGIEPEMLEDTPECAAVFTANLNNNIYKRDAALYNYAVRESLSIMGCDLEAAGEMGLIPKDISLTGAQTAITSHLAEEYAYEVGDTIWLEDETGSTHAYEIAYILPNSGILESSNMALLSEEGMLQLFADQTITYTAVYIDLADDSQAEEMKNCISLVNPQAEVTSLHNTKEITETAASTKKIFLVLFAVCLLLVLFVTISVSERIICEKMSVIGTFRSLGISRGITSLILLLENCFYGLIGGAAGAGIYGLLREMIFGSFFSFDTSGMEAQIDMGHPSLAVCAGVIAGAAAIECLCPIREIMKAAKTSIRDIIFDNKDTEYHSTRLEMISGVVLLLAAVISAVCPKSYWSLLICFGASISAVFFLYPCIIRIFSLLLEKLTAVLSMPVAHFAAVEIRKKKSTVGSGRLCVTAVSMCLVLFVLSNSLNGLYIQDIYDCDILLYGLTESRATYSFIEHMEGVDDCEYIYRNFSKTEINGQEKNMDIFGYTPFKYFDGILDLPEELNEDECVIDQVLAGKLGVTVGEELTITFQSDGFFPVTRTLKLSGYCNSIPYDSAGQSVLISQKLYEEVFRDYPAQILLKTDDLSIKDKIENYSAGYISDIKTVEEYRQEQEKEASGMTGLFLTLILLGTGLTLIGNISNQLIGLEGRRRECAVLLSTSMSREKLGKQFLLETIFSVSAALLVAVPLGIFLLKPLIALLALLDMRVSIVSPLTETGIFLGALWLLFCITVLLPVRHIRKMNIASQLKYE